MTLTTSSTPLKIGDIELAMPVALAPMSGVTDMPFRKAVRSYGCGLVVTEMIASREALRGAYHNLRLEMDLDVERPVSVQLAGWDPSIMAEAAQLCVSHGAEMIDINMGCPAKKVTKRASGSALMQDLDNAEDIVKAVVKAVDVPVTLKMRTGWTADTRNAVDLAQRAEAAGVKMLVVHGRSACQLYNGRADWDFIAGVKQAVSIPLIGNGDVVTVEQAAALMRDSGVDGLMIGRGAYGRPWFPNQVGHYLATGEKLPDPSPVMRGQTLLTQYLGMLDLFGERVAVRRARKHLAWYATGLRNANQWRVSVQKMTDPDDVMAEIERFFSTATVDDGVQTDIAA
ncbi:MAG: tRNA dihydrouridine synthase DusB [Alphaproteobacteria bacterium]